jgi:hypothetical protein
MVVGGLEEALVTSGQVWEIADQELTDGAPKLECVREETVDHEVIRAGTEGRERHPGEGFGGGGRSRLPREHESPELGEKTRGVAEFAERTCSASETPQQVD